jgi:penicillin-binding protein 1C
MGFKNIYLSRSKGNANDDNINAIEEIKTIIFQNLSFLNNFLSFIYNNYNMLRRRRILKTRYFRQKILAQFLLLIVIVIVFVFLSSVIIFAWYSKDLPSPGKIKRTTGYSTLFLDRDEKPIYEMYKDKNRMPVDIKEVPNNLKNATVAIEDKDFYKHQGFSFRGILRALVNIIFRFRLQGGSTLTQQLIKNVLLTPERSITRKIKEFILATEVERRYSKQEILQMYLNEAPYGGTFWGIESAAKGYFAKDVKDLNLVESAFLAGLPQRPSFYSPFVGKSNAYIDRTKDVLRRMREDAYITSEQEKKENEEILKMKFTAPKISFNAPHFVFYVRDQIIDLLGEKALDQGLKIKTTLSLDVQKIAEKIVKEEIEKLKGLNATNGAAVILDSKTEEILAMVGSVDYNNNKFGKYNTALALRQPGSAIKPVTYAVALEKGYTPATVIMDLPTVFPNQGGKDYITENYDGKFRGPVQLRFALGNSINVASVKLLAMVGIRDFLQKAYDMGLSTFEPNQQNLNRFGLSITLGGGETRLLDLTSAFAIFARGGLKKSYSSILEISDYQNKLIYKAKKPTEKRVLSAEVTFLISHILSDNNARIDIFGPRSYLNIPGKTVAAKTGTTNDKRDNWAIGYTKGVTLGVWVGNNDNSPMNPKIASGASGASPIWYRLMSNLLGTTRELSLHKTYSDGIMDKPDNVNAYEIDAYLGGLPKEGYPKRSEYFISGTEPKDISLFYKKLKISKNNDKLANDLEIKAGEYDEKEYIVISEKDPVSTDGINRWQQAVDEWQRSQPDDKFKFPTEVSDSKKEEVIVQVKEPSNKSRIDSNTISLKAKIVSLDDIKKVEIYVNGNIITTYNENKKEIEEPLSLSDGVYEIKVRAENNKGKIGESSIKIGINKPWDYVSPTPPSSSPTSTPDAFSPTSNLSP